MSYIDTKPDFCSPQYSRVPDRVYIGANGGCKFFAYSELNDVSGFWKSLERNGIYSPFQSLAWVQALIQSETSGVNFGSRRHLFVVGFAVNKPVLLLPLSIRRDILVTRLTWLGEKMSDYNGMIVDRSYAAIMPDLQLCRITNMLRVAFPEIQAAHLIRIPVDRFDIDQTRETGSTTTVAEFRSHAVTLKRNWPELYSGIRSGKSRQRLRSKYRSLKKLGNVQFRQVRGNSERKVLARQILEWKSGQLLASGRRDPFKCAGEPTSACRAIDVAVASEENGTLKVFGLFLDGEPVAGMLAFVTGGTFYYFVSAYSPKVSNKYSIGVQLLLKTLELASRSGNERYDFLIGDEQYKADWCDTEIPLVTYARPFSFRGRLLCAGLDLRLNLKKLVVNCDWLNDLARAALKFRHQRAIIATPLVKPKIGMVFPSHQSRFTRNYVKADCLGKSTEDA